MAHFLDTPQLGKLNNARMYKMLKGNHNFKLFLSTCLFYPFVVLSIFLFFNFFLEIEDSGNSLEFLTVL